MARIAANYINRALTADNFAVFADSLDAGPDFHDELANRFLPAWAKACEYSG
jgi:hypothetical protein